VSVKCITALGKLVTQEMVAEAQKGSPKYINQYIGAAYHIISKRINTDYHYDETILVRPC